MLYFKNSNEFSKNKLPDRTHSTPHRRALPWLNRCKLHRQVDDSRPLMVKQARQTKWC